MVLVRYVTFDGIAKACAKAGGFAEPELVHFNPKDFDFGASGPPECWNTVAWASVLLHSL